jgi:hypothetical protein
MTKEEIALLLDSAAQVAKLSEDAHALRLAAFVKATIRPDDADPITAEWILDRYKPNQMSKERDWFAFELPDDECAIDGTWIALWLDGSDGRWIITADGPGDKCKRDLGFAQNRGSFRRLLHELQFKEETYPSAK